VLHDEQTKAGLRRTHVARLPASRSEPPPVSIIERDGGALGATGQPWDTTLPDLCLSEDETSDLLLALEDVLPPGALLGGSDRPENRAPTGTVAVRVPSEETARDALAAGGLVLRDEEFTPVAALERLRPHGGREPLLLGVPRGLRRHESAVPGHLRVDVGDERLHDRHVLVVARPPMASDLTELRERLAGRPVLLLVPEQSASRQRVPTGALVELTAALTSGLGPESAELRTIPLVLRGPAHDEPVIARLAARLAARDVEVLSDTRPAPSAARWRAARALMASDAPHPFDGMPSGSEGPLRGWMPRRSKRGLTVMFTGLSGSGKSTLARDTAAWIAASSTRTVTVLDGDRVRRLLSSGLGFDLAARELNLRRIAFTAAEVARHGGIAICCPIAPTVAIRKEVRHMAEETGDFVLVHVSTPLEECERRDLKGLYALARQGIVENFTGISSPYEPPEDADLQVDTSAVPRADGAALVTRFLLAGGWIGRRLA
jgi:sulfate adenylyltransferase